MTIKTLEPGQEPEEWQRYGVTAVPTLVVTTTGGKPAVLRGLSDATKITNAVGVTHEGK